MHRKFGLTHYTSYTYYTNYRALKFRPAPLVPAIIFAAKIKACKSLTYRLLLLFVGVTRLELATSRPPDAYSNQLSYTPIRSNLLLLRGPTLSCLGGLQ